MARTIRHAKIDSPTARRKLKRGRQAHWHPLGPGMHLGWQWQTDRPEGGRWLLRRYIGRRTYRVTPVGRADDVATADGSQVLSFAQAQAAANAMTDTPKSKVHRLTVRQAMERYIAHKETLGQRINDVQSRSNAHILPPLGNLVVEQLTAEHLRRWLATMAAAPAQKRPKQGKLSFKSDPKMEDDVRRRRASANRVLTMLKAALNHSYDEGHISNRDAWGRKLKPFRDVETARVRYLTVAEAQRLLNACDQDFRPLVRAALETGCRYSELARLEVHDFNKDAGTVTIRKSKTSKARHVVLTDDGKACFKQHCAKRAGNALMFTHADGTGWKASEQARVMDAANEHARLRPRVTFHALRHSWASLAAMNGVPLLVVAKNLGHSDTRMVEKHYGHMAPSYIAEAIRAGAPRFGDSGDKKVVPLR